MPQPTPPVSRTARYMALFRAMETARGRRALVADPFAARFLTPGLRAAAEAARLPGVGAALEAFVDRRWPGAWSSGVARTRLIDGWMDDALARGARQVVLLGAGFDCRALRLPSLRAVPVFEVDRAELLADKRRRLGSVGRRGLVDVPVDFLRDDLGAKLEGAGFRVGEQTAFLWEGVTNYLDEASVGAMFDLFARVAAPRSRIAFTYVHADVVAGRFVAPGLAALTARLEASGERWTFGFRPEALPGYLGARGLRLVTDLGAAEYRPLALGRRAEGLVGYEFYRVAVAERVGAAEA